MGGIGSEFVQGLLPYRDFDIKDIYVSCTLTKICILLLHLLALSYVCVSTNFSSSILEAVYLHCYLIAGIINVSTSTTNEGGS